MRIKTLSVEELTYFANFLKQLSGNMAKAPETKAKLQVLAKKYRKGTSTGYLSVKPEDILASLGLINTAVVSIKQTGTSGEIADKSQAEYLDKVVMVLQTIQSKLSVESAK